VSGDGGAGMWGYANMNRMVFVLCKYRGVFFGILLQFIIAVSFYTILMMVCPEAYSSPEICIRRRLLVIGVIGMSIDRGWPYLSYTTLARILCRHNY
jgi:hypothetical protein